MDLPSVRRLASSRRVIPLAIGALVAAGCLVTHWMGAAWLWLGPGPTLRPQVEARLNQDGTRPVSRWNVLRIQTRNSFPLWQNALDDDPVYSLEVDLDVEYTNGNRALLRWSTWRYGFVVGPFVYSYGDGPPGRLSPVAD